MRAEINYLIQVERSLFAKGEVKITGAGKGGEMTGLGVFPDEWTFPSEMDMCWIDGEPGKRSLQDCPSRVVASWKLFFVKVGKFLKLQKVREN